MMKVWPGTWAKCGPCEASTILPSAQVEELRGSPLNVGNLEEIIDEKCGPAYVIILLWLARLTLASVGPHHLSFQEDAAASDRTLGQHLTFGECVDCASRLSMRRPHACARSHAIISTSTGTEYYVGVLSIVDKGQLEPGSTVLLHSKVLSVVGLLSDEADPMVSVMKVRTVMGWAAARCGRSDGILKDQRTLEAQCLLPAVKLSLHLSSLLALRGSTCVRLQTRRPPP